MSILGHEVRRLEDPAMLTRGGCYVGDIPMPGALWAAFVRSPLAHARIVRIDTSAASAAPGIAGVYTGQDLGCPEHPAVFPHLKPEWMHQPVLAHDQVRYVGEIVAVVVSEDRAAAADAAELVEVDYEPLPVITNVEESVTDQVLIFDEAPGNVIATVEAGPGASFEECAVIVRQRMVNQRQSGAPIEPRAAIAAWDGERLTQWASCQGAHPNREFLARAHGLDVSDVRVIIPDVGGGFGSKGRLFREEVTIGLLARRLGRPVRWTATRVEDMLCLPHGRAQVHEVTIGGTRDGRITAYQLEVIQDCGAFVLFAPILINSTGRMTTGVYDIPNVGYRGRATLTNTAPTSAFRGAGRPEAAAAVERAVDMFAAEIEMDPVEVRRRNMVPAFDNGYTTGVGTIYDTGDYERALDLVVEAVGYESLRQEQARRRTEGSTRLIGIGLATYVEVTGGAPGGEYGSVELLRDGRVRAVSGSTPTGQGHRTAWSMLVAAGTGVALEEVEVIHGDTDRVPASGVTGGSRSTQAAGSSLFVATEKLVDMAREEVSRMLEASVEDIVLDVQRGAFHVVGAPARSVTWAEVAAAAPEPLQAVSDFVPASSTFPFGAHAAVVEVDIETGRVALLRMVAVDDAGRILNPMLAHGQVHGGLCCGIGQALFEEVVFDEDGNPLTTTFADYGIPSAAEVPSFELVDCETPTFMNPLGAKGIGESGSIGSTPAIQNAVVDAIAHLGVRHIDLPLTPERVWRSIHTAALR
ncbi:MAG: xanthine dehydrogenase family protein molybdopterin-binding subunit [Acidimicrobiales bacterium]|nr:xanthine dehydrogenase family protein molybdopterin-binding subunit [Acidimicrobiales bacterium]